jgi:hypothetical protein
MSLTPDEWRRLVHLLNKLDRPDIIEQLERPPSQKGGNPEMTIDDLLLPYIELFVRIARRDRGMKRTPALRWIADIFFFPGITATSREALVARLRKKLKERGFEERDIETLVRPGIHSTMLSLGAGDLPLLRYRDVLRQK